jgi:hypothetical protein
MIALSTPRWDHITDVMKPADGWEHGFCDTHLCHCDYTPDNCYPVGDCPGLNFLWGSSLEDGKKHITFSHEPEAEDFILNLMTLKKNGTAKQLVTASLDFNDLLGLQLAVDIAVRRYKHWDKSFDWSDE